MGIKSRRNKHSTTNNMYNRNKKGCIIAENHYEEGIAVLATQMSMQTSFADMLELYADNVHILRDWTFIVATTEADNMNLYIEFDELSGIEDRLFTPFANGRASVINNKILQRCLLKNDSRARIYRCVSFDTQTVSYVERYYKQCRTSYEGFGTVIRLLKGDSIGVDCIPYAMENLMFDFSRRDSVEQTLFAFEMMCGENAGNEKKCRKRAQRIVSLYGDKGSEVIYNAKETYKMIYLVLLKMSQIQLQFGKITADKKMSLFVDFLTTELCRMMQPETNLAKVFFTKGTSCGFFGKIQIGNKNILGQLKNMAWDLMHLRFLNCSSAMFDAQNADALIPYFFTYDRRLQNVRECYSLRALAINTKVCSVIPIYMVDDDVYKMLREYGSLEKYQERVHKKPDLEKLIDKYERLIAELGA